MFRLQFLLFQVLPEKQPTKLLQIKFIKMGMHQFRNLIKQN